MGQDSTNQVPREVLKHLEELGWRVRTARLRRCISTEDLAQACGIGRRTLFRIETGEAGVALANLFIAKLRLVALHGQDASSVGEKRKVKRIAEVKGVENGNSEPVATEFCRQRLATKSSPAANREIWHLFSASLKHMRHERFFAKQTYISELFSTFACWETP